MDMMFAPQYDHVELLIHLDPSCQYQVRVKASMREMVQQVSLIILTIIIWTWCLPPQYDHVELLIHLDPSCQYQVRVKASMREMVQQVSLITSE